MALRIIIIAYDITTATRALSDLGLKHIRLHTNSPAKEAFVRAALGPDNVTVQRMTATPTPHNRTYLEEKVKMLNHHPALLPVPQRLTVLRASGPETRAYLQLQAIVAAHFDSKPVHNFGLLFHHSDKLAGVTVASSNLDLNYTDREFHSSSPPASSDPTTSSDSESSTDSLCFDVNMRLLKALRDEGYRADAVGARTVRFQGRADDGDPFDHVCVVVYLSFDSDSGRDLQGHGASDSTSQLECRGGGTMMERYRHSGYLVDVGNAYPYFEPLALDDHVTEYWHAPSGLGYRLRRGLKDPSQLEVQHRRHRYVGDSEEWKVSYTLTATVASRSSLTRNSEFTHPAPVATQAVNCTALSQSDVDRIVHSHATRPTFGPFLGGIRMSIFSQDPHLPNACLHNNVLTVYQKARDQPSCTTGIGMSTRTVFQVPGSDAETTRFQTAVRAVFGSDALAKCATKALVILK